MEGLEYKQINNQNVECTFLPEFKVARLQESQEEHGAAA